MNDPIQNEPEETLETAAPAPEVDRQTLLSSIAGQLMKAREASGQSIDDVMRDLKLRRIYIEALESGNWDNMPGQIYALGFLRQYAAHLHLDLEEEIALLKDGKYRLTKPLTYPDPPIAPSRKWAIAVGIAFAVLLLLFNISRHDEPGDVVPPVTQTAPEPAAPAPAPETGEAPVAGETATEAAQPPVIAPEAIAPAQPPAAADNSNAAAGPMHRVDLEAVDSEAWIEIYLPDADGAASGEPYKQHLLQAGEHLLIDTTSPELLITCGNAASLQISVDGELRVTAGSLGKPGKVIRDYRLVTGTPAGNSTDHSTDNGPDDAAPAQSDLSD